MQKMKKWKPDWAYRAENIPHKPNWIDFIPHELWELGKVFFPIPSRRKAWKYPHHLDDYRYEADDEMLNAHLESGFGYGISCAGDIAVVDVDEKDKVKEVTENLPETLWQLSGSREGVHLFYFVEGLNTRQILYYKWADEWHHLGEVKCDPHGYVIGPGSKHPSGNIYGPLKGDGIATITKENLLKSLDGFIKPNECDECGEEIDDGKVFCEDCGETRLVEYKKEASESNYQFYNLTCNDVIPWLEPGKRIPHPVHGSSTGSNFMRTEDSESFMCWRHDYGGSQGCALNPQQLLAVKATGDDCDKVRNSWKHNEWYHLEAWKQAVKERLISYEAVPFKVAVGYGKDNEMIKSQDELRGDIYWDIINAVTVEMQEEYLPSKPSYEGDAVGR